MTSGRPQAIELRGLSVSLDVGGDKGRIMVAKLPRPLQARERAGQGGAAGRGWPASTDR